MHLTRALSLLAISIPLQIRSFAGVPTPIPLPTALTSAPDDYSPINANQSVSFALKAQQDNPPSEKPRLKLSTGQKSILNAAYEEEPRGRITRNQSYSLAVAAGISPDQVRNYINNRRLRECNLDNPVPSRQRTHIKTEFTQEQKQMLKQTYQETKYPSPTRIKELAVLLSLSCKTIRNFFTNTRARDKRKAKEDDFFNRQRSVRITDSDLNSSASASPVLSSAKLYTGSAVADGMFRPNRTNRFTLQNQTATFHYKPTITTGNKHPAIESAFSTPSHPSRIGMNQPETKPSGIAPCNLSAPSQSDIQRIIDSLDQETPDDMPPERNHPTVIESRQEVNNPTGSLFQLLIGNTWDQG